MVGCKSIKNNDEISNSSKEMLKESLYQTKWSLIKLGSQKPKFSNENIKITLQFNKENSYASGYSGCNRYNGKYETKNNTLSFGNFISTKMACPEENMKIEDNFLKTLPKTNNFEIIGDTLLLKNKERTIMVFIAE
jgi:putative lipoprotein